MRLVRQLLLFLFICVAVLVCWQPLIYVDDFWMHAAFGRWIVENHTLLHSDPFIWSYTGPWIAHSWLAELGAYGLMRIGGEQGGPTLAVVIVEIAVLIEFTIILWPLNLKSGMAPLPALLATCGLLASVARFSPRPDLFTTLFLILLYRMLDFWRKPSSNKPNKFSRSFLVVVPVMFALWANLHGAVAIGLIALWACFIADGIQFKWDAATKTLGVVAAISTLAILINPYGLAYLEIYKPLANSSFYYIDEWRPLWQPPAMDPRVGLMEILLVVSASTALWLNPSRKLSHIAWLLVGAGAIVSARRNADICSLTSLYIVIANYSQAAASPILSKLDARPLTLTISRAGSIVCGSIVTLWLLQTGLGTLFSQLSAGFAIVNPRLLQEGQAAAIEKVSSPDARVLNPFDTSKYLEWSLAGNPKLFIDGTNCYPAQTFRDYVDMWSMSPRGVALFQSLGINIVVGFRPSNVDGQTLEAYLSSNPDWVKLYDGNEGPVFVKRSYLAEERISTR